jgi:ribonuclease HIII
MTLYTCKLNEAQGKSLLAILRGHGFEFKEAPHAEFAAARQNVQVVFYHSGKLVVQGKGTGEFVEFTLEPQVLQEARLGYEAVHDPDFYLPRIGVDESGKGDFFGPLCIAGVYANEQVIKHWNSLGIRDSKRIGSDRRISELARQIRETPGCVWTVAPVGNEAYNRLYKKMGNLNSLLAWGHARVIENLLGLGDRMNPPPQRAISDQFARQESTVKRAMMALGRELELIQRHRGEEDMVVAAASILARDEFVSRLSRLSAEYGITLPKGASPAVEAAGRQFVERHGADKLPKVAKMHFRTADRVQNS